jgi:hypothetical protein
MGFDALGSCGRVRFGDWLKRMPVDYCRNQHRFPIPGMRHRLRRVFALAQVRDQAILARRMAWPLGVSIADGYPGRTYHGEHEDGRTDA